jgi:hypothetical protein
LRLQSSRIAHSSPNFFKEQRAGLIWGHFVRVKSIVRAVARFQRAGPQPLPRR